MEIIIENAKRFIKTQFTILKYEEFLNNAISAVSNIDDHLDKIKYLNCLLEYNNDSYQAHLSQCRSPGNCRYHVAYENVNYYLTQELSRLGVKLDLDGFTSAEKHNTDSKIDEILKDLNVLKVGQQILFEEITELRDLYFLGKKKWHQILIGKGSEMVAGGIISEIVAKKIVEEFGKNLPLISA